MSNFPESINVNGHEISIVRSFDLYAKLDGQSVYLMAGNDGAVKVYAPHKDRMGGYVVSDDQDIIDGIRTVYCNAYANDEAAREEMRRKEAESVAEPSIMDTVDWSYGEDPELSRSAKRRASVGDVMDNI